MKYRLIQTYPGYETLGTIHCSENKTPEWRGTNFYDAHPKYWQKVEEVDYKILSFIRIDSTCVPKDSIGILFESQEDGLFGTYNKYSFHSEKQMLEGKYSVKTGFFAIHSVKRLSDGEVFTIGDNINYDHYSNFNKITKISIVQKGNIKEGVWVNYAGGSCHLSIAKKLPKKTPLFTTEDGVDIFECDDFWIVESDFSFYKCNEPAHSLSGRYSERKYLSTKEKAEEYILLNKPCLCLNDLKTIWEGANFPIEVSVLFKRFKKLAKSKL